MLIHALISLHNYKDAYMYSLHSFRLQTLIQCYQVGFSAKNKMPTVLGAQLILLWFHVLISCLSHWTIRWNLTQLQESLHVVLYLWSMQLERILCTDNLLHKSSEVQFDPDLLAKVKYNIPQCDLCDLCFMCISYPSFICISEQHNVLDFWRFIN